MQLLLPLFPSKTIMISPTLGVRRDSDGVVSYIHSGCIIYQHYSKDIQHFRYITSSFINLHICTQAEVCRAFKVSEDSVYRAYKTFKEKGENGFFGPEIRHGRAYKLVGEKLEHIQSKLDAGQSVNSIAKEEDVRESSIRAAINRGALKKKREPVEPDPQQAQKESVMTGTSSRI